MRRFYRLVPRDFWLGLITLAGVVVIDVLAGLIIGVVLSIVLFIAHASRPRVSVLGSDPAIPGAYVDVERHPEAQPIDGVLLVKPNAPIFYANAQAVRDAIDDLVREAGETIAVTVLDLDGNDDIDITTADQLIKLEGGLKRRSVTLCFVHVHAPTLRIAEEAGLIDARASHRTFATVADAVAWARNEGLPRDPDGVVIIPPDRRTTKSRGGSDMSAKLPTGAERKGQGKAARAVAPLDSHREFVPAPGRDAVGLLLGQAGTRVPELVPIRHGRMLVSAFTFFRGAALPMAADLATTPTTGLRVQLCGDAHLSNFGAFASPERRLVFDLNDFDESLPGPFEWDVKRLAASFAVAGRDNGFTPKERHTAIVAAVAGYRTAMREFASMPMLAVWYSHLDVEQASRALGSKLSKEEREADQEGGRQSAYPRQHAGAGQADHHGGRAAPDHQRSAPDRARRGAVHPH